MKLISRNAWHHNELLKNAPFKHFIISQSFSMAGDAICLAALPIAFIRYGYETDVFGLVMASVGVGTVLGAWAAGTLMAQVCPKKAIVYSDISRGLLQIIATLLIYFNEAWWTLSITYLVFGACIGASRPFAHVLIVTILPKDQLSKGNATINFIDNIAAIIFPATLGVLIIMKEPLWGIFIDGLTFFCAAFFTNKMRLHAAPASLERDPKTSFYHGIKTVLRSKTLLKGFTATLLINVLCFPLFFSIAPFAVSNRFEAETWGVCLAACGVGACVGSIIATRVQSGQHLTLLTISSGFALSLGFMLLGLGTSAWIVIAGATLVGLVEAMWLTGWSTIMQTETSLSALGKVSSLDTLMTSGLHPLIYGGAGSFAIIVGHSQLLIFGAFTSLAAIILPTLLSLLSCQRKQQHD